MSERGPGVAIVGCGQIGMKRFRALGSARLVAAADIELTRASDLAGHQRNAVAFADWRDAVDHPDVAIVIVSTLHDSLAEIAAGAIAAGRHVLLEKPAGRFPSEIEPLIAAAEQAGVRVRVGFNHRFHPAVRKARALVDEGAVGDLMFVRARYGHGGRVGYDREWRSDAERSGGGELIDQGPHLIDLSRWFLGEFTYVDGFAQTCFWNMPVDDNGFLLLRTDRQQTAFLHVSCTEWKNLFSMEIYGRDGKLEINGLGGSYGVERITFYKMLPQMGPPETTMWEFPFPDESWTLEFAEFLEDIRLGREPAAGLRDALAAAKVINAIYRKSGYDYNT
jgi:predicted dehydrogenase